MRSKDNKVLAICIPTYNRRDGVCKLVNHLLSCKDTRFCVHVSDNCSTDATLEQLSAISDDRLSITSPISNIPAYDNYHNSIVTAPARYAILLLDKESLDISLISDFIDFLIEKKPDFGVLGNRFRLPVENRYTTYCAGNQAVMMGGGQRRYAPDGVLLLHKQVQRMLQSK